MAAQLSASQVSHWNDLLRNTGISTSRQLMHLHKIIFHLSNQTRFHADKLLECWWRQVTRRFLCIRVPHHNFDGFGNSCNEALVANRTGRSAVLVNNRHILGFIPTYNILPTDVDAIRKGRQLHIGSQLCLLPAFHLVQIRSTSQPSHGHLLNIRNPEVCVEQSLECERSISSILYSQGHFQRGSCQRDHKLQHEAMVPNRSGCLAIFEDQDGCRALGIVLQRRQ
mmetsp:Transcript_50125/g.80010  ORF Transcript_50125/g.80010 Transcript_50125/m.80010 type:complete len:225 (-) Transcript_50125:315-989(-)